MSLYEDLDKMDLLARLKPAFDAKTLWLNHETGKITYKKSLPWDTPWLTVKQSSNFNCAFWHGLLFRYFKKEMGNPPVGCQKCWKVVCKPRTLSELFDIKRVQEKLDLPSKCGIEMRASVPSLYGGYWYNRTQDEGFDTLNKVRQELYAYGLREVKCYLKRGCTEMEHFFGDSSKWRITDSVKHWDDLFHHWMEPFSEMPEQHPLVYVTVLKKWVEFAHANGDNTYLMFTDNKHLYPQSTTYEE